MTTPAAQAAAVFAEIERIPFLSSPERGGLMVMNRPRCLRSRPSGASGVEHLCRERSWIPRRCRL